MRHLGEERGDNNGDSAECAHPRPAAGTLPHPKINSAHELIPRLGYCKGLGIMPALFGCNLHFHECFGLSLFLLHLPPCPHELQASMNTWQKSVRFESRDGLQINLATVFFAFKPLSLIPPPVRVARTRGDQGLHVTAIFPLGHLGTTREIKKAN